MFPANSHPAIILFNSGALHSFIASKFIAKHNLPITIMKYTMIVSSSRGQMKTKHICLAISIAIKGVDFLSNLITIDSKGIHIILGMDWLRKYDRVILCTKSYPVDLRRWDHCGVHSSNFYQLAQCAQSSERNISR
jgi:hypothetical protein